MYLLQNFSPPHNYSVYRHYTVLTLVIQIINLLYSFIVLCRHYTHVLKGIKYWYILKIRELLDQKGKTKYWLHNQINMDYNNLSRLMNNETDKIRFENIEKLCNILDCTPNDLFEIIPDDKDLSQ